jgi:hypothetical protein
MDQLTAEDPQWIGQYRLLRRLGSGGMGRVYLGRTAGGRTVAVKRVHAEFADDAEFRARFRQEVSAARQVGGRWTAPVFDADTEGPQPWVATGYVAGPSLQAAVREFGPLPATSVRALGTGLAEALAAVHGLGLVHRDVKPSNVLLALDGPRLIDFGITRALDAAVQLTRTGLLVGSPGYLSPEQAQGAVAGPASDVFSLGAVLAFAAAGTPPFGEGQPAATLLYRVLHEAPDLGRVEPGLRPLVAACMAKNPAERPTPDQLRAGLEADGDTVLLGAAGWLPPAISASVGRLAVELLDLDAGPGQPGPGQAGAAITATAQAVQTAVPQQTFPPTQASAPPPQHIAAPMPPQTVPTAMATMTGAMPPPFAPMPPPASSRHRVPVIALGAVGIVAVAVVGLVVALTLSLSSGAPSASQSTTSHSTTAHNAAPGGVVPASFIGQWQGTVTGLGPKPLAIAVSIGQGKPGDQVGVVTNDTGNGYFCQVKTTLVSAGTARVVMRDIPGTATVNCAPIMDDQSYTLNADGTMQLVLAGYRATLTRQ